jgi:hypothetical protein
MVPAAKLAAGAGAAARLRRLTAAWRDVDRLADLGEDWGFTLRSSPLPSIPPCNPWPGVHGATTVPKPLG